MIDFVLGAVLGGLAVWAYFHFKGEPPAKALAEITGFEQRIRTMLSDAFNTALANLQAAAEAKGAADAKAATEAAVAAKEQEATDAIEAATAALTPPG
jgi:hypothetical protein